MTSERWTLEEVCEKKSSNLMQKDLNLGTGEFPIYGASGLLGYVDFYQRDKEYIGIVKDGAGVGRAMLLPAKSSCIGTMQYLVPKDCISSHYLYYAVESMNLAKYNTGATIPHIYFRDYKKETLPKKGRDEQEYIASNLDKVVETIRKRRLQLQFFDDLVKSQFIEMFGDPERNEKGWNIVPLSQIAEYFNGLTYRPEDRDDKGTIVLRSSNIQQGELDFSDIVRVQCRVKEKLYVKSGDILMCSRNGSANLVGKVAQIPQLSEPMTFGAFMMIIRSQVPEYLTTYFRLNAFRNQIKTGATTTINQITTAMLNKVRLPLPPRTITDKFARFVEQTDKSKVLFTQKLFFQLYMAICVKAFEKNAQMLYNCRREVAR